MGSYRSSRRGRTSRIFFGILVLVLAAGAGVYYKTVMMPRAERAESPTPRVPATKPAGAVMLSAATETTPTRTLLPTPPGATPATRPAMPPASTGPTMPAGAAAKLLADSKAKADAGDSLAARALLNDALNAGSLSESDADAVRTAITALNAKIIFSPQRFNDPSITIEQIETGHGLKAIAKAHGIPWEAICRVNGVSDRKIRIGQGLKAPNGPFNVMVTKHAFRIDLYLGGLPGESGALYVGSLPVGLGKDDSTPTGLWVVQQGSKGKALAWTNPRTNEHFDGADPKNPLGGFWIGLRGEGGNAVGKQSYGIHGTIEPDSIGKQASMGCIRLRHDDIAYLYDLLTEEKSRVLVRD